MVAGDVKALYPSIQRPLALEAIGYALEKFSNFGKKCNKILIDLISHCFDSVIVQHGQRFFKQNTGIVTGDNHSVSIANITLHFVLLPISDTINKAELFKRYIDDIIWLSYGQEITNNIQDALITAFGNASLELTFRSIQTGGFSKTDNKMEFLDVEHEINNSFK